jgi:4-hydroxybenzoate polyprenyltransferase
MDAGAAGVAAAGAVADGERLDTAAPIRVVRRGRIALIVEGMRPRHLLKNGFVLAGLMFSGTALKAGPEVRTWLATAAFCLISGSVYLFNDVLDVEIDQHNPRTAKRPIARGDLSPRTALVAAAASAAAALLLGALANLIVLGVIAGFLVLQLCYSRWLKHMLFIDVMCIAAGFVLRALAGLAAVDVGVSPWLLTATALLALFLGFAKRRGEVVALGGAAHPTRPVLEQYSLALLDELIMVVTPSMVVVYALYCVLGARTQYMLLTLPFVLYGIFRMLFMIHHRSRFTEDPATAVWLDRPLLVDIALWIVVAGLVSVLSGVGPEHFH